jgi:multidrug efflux pump subunit AcrB
MMFSMLVAFVVTPWTAYQVLSTHTGGGHHEGEKEDWGTRMYRQFMNPLIHHPSLGAAFLIFITLLLFAAVNMVANGMVKVKMLPYDNKSELQVIIDMDEGTTLERTTNVAMELARSIAKEPEVLNYQVYAGTSSPYNFNGLVRHYFLRKTPNVADIQVNLVNREERDQQSHDIAKRIRNNIAPLAKSLGARIKVAEIPPGPPVLQTIVAEIYGPNYQEQIEIGKRMMEILESTPGVVDVDSYIEAEQPRLIMQFDQEKAALHHIGAEQVAGVIRIAQNGEQAGLLHVPDEQEDVQIRVRLPISQRSQPNKLLPVPVCAGEHCVPLGELTRATWNVGDKSIHHKNLLPVVYVTADVAGVEESPVYVLFGLNEKIGQYIPAGRNAPMEIWNISQPFSTQLPSMKWDGEWHITYEVFRDLGLAFAVVLILIYILVVGWFASFRIPLVIMCAIPFSLVGIMPAHWAMGAFFTATSMIGFIAGAGIVVRNSIILVDFIHLRLEEGMNLEEAVVDAGAIRFRPMMLTAMAVVVGGSVILFDPIFQGLAVALISGEIASLFLSRMAVPVIYYFSARHEHKRKLQDQAAASNSAPQIALKTN